ncbi:MAG: hypothetical protein HQL93_10410 [Magnetococcales bacterium]|nr:hypothetical protein [Magnetococcales bacterium]
MRETLFIPVRWILAGLLLHLSFIGHAGADDLVIVINAANLVTELTPAQISDLYLGRSRTFPDGSHAKVVEQLRESPLRQQFFQKINGMTLNQVNTYWARLTFTGRVLPPESKNNNHEVVQTVLSNPNAIGYISRSDLTPSIRAVLILNE